MAPWVSPDNTLEQQAQRVATLYLEVVDLSDGLGVPANDARRVALNNIASAISAEVGILRLIDHINRQTPEVRRHIFGVGSDATFEVVRQDVLTAGRGHLLVESQFQIENALRNVLRTLDPARQIQGFVNIVKEAVGRSGVTDTDAIESVLRTAAKIRNTLHANGIHHGPPIEIAFGGVRFELVDGAPAECGSIQHITELVRASVNATIAVFRGPRVAALAFVADSYVQARRPGAAAG